MKICIYGAGAIGGYLGTQLALAGEDVTLIARGQHLEAIQWDGIRLRIGGEERIAYPRSTARPSEAGEQDLVFVTVKSYSVPEIIGPMQPLLGSDTAVVWAVNGMPWWYFYRLEGPWRNHRIEAVDPGGVAWEGIGPERIIGCVASSAASVVAPGVIEHHDGRRFTLGEPGGEATRRVRDLSRRMIAAGFRAPMRDIRTETWVELWANLSFNPVSVLTGATLDVIAADPGTRDVCRRMMHEARAIGEKLGVRFPVDLERRLDGGATVGQGKSPMLQDFERRKPLEIDALVTAVQELGRLVGVPTPTLDTVLALVKRRAARTRPQRGGRDA